MSAPPLDAVDPLRRRLAIAMSGSPFAGVLNSALAATGPEPVSGAGATAATGRWVHAFAAFGEP